MKKNYRNTRVRISELASRDDVLTGFDFYHCTIEGPAVITTLEGCKFRNCQWLGDTDALAWTIEPGRRGVIGAILFDRTIFAQCRFERVGFAGTAARIAQWQLGNSRAI